MQGVNNPVVQSCRSSSRVTRASGALTRRSRCMLRSESEIAPLWPQRGTWRLLGDQYCAYRVTEPKRQPPRLTLASLEMACQHSSSICLEAAVWGHHILGQKFALSCVSPCIQLVFGNKGTAMKMKHTNLLSPYLRYFVLIHFGSKFCSLKSIQCCRTNLFISYIRLD